MKKRYLIYLIYLLVVTTVFLSSTFLAKYVTDEKSELDFTVGSVLYFNYERSDFYRNNQVVPTTPSVYVEDDNTYQLLEAMNIVPGDNLTYHFYVSNFDSETGDQNIIDGLFYPNTYATLSLPTKSKIYNVESTILYRAVPFDATDTSTPAEAVWNNLTEGTYLDLPPVAVRKVKYEFKVSVIVGDQVDETTHEDYFDAVLTIKLFINAASDE